MSAPTFSIVTATYNAGPLLSRTATSLRSQQFCDFEWLVIDGGSKDDTVQQIEATRDLVTFWQSERDEGIADAWNKGIQRAKGTHILILNAGDAYDPNFLQILSGLTDGERILCSHARLISESGQPAGLFRSEPAKLRWGMHLPHNWCAVPTKHYRGLGLYRKLPLAMDFDWFHRYFQRHGVAGFRVIDAALGSYYLGGCSDARYREGFQINEQILIENGCNPLTARSIRLLYQAKHLVKRRIAATG